MTPSRELDQLVAFKVMGIHRRDGGWFNSQVNIVYNHDGDKRGGFLELPRYSTDIAAAWMVVDKMFITNEWDFKIYSDQGELHPWICEITRSIGGPPLAEQESETVSHAICIAALKAVGAIS